ncbi:hypothetical protein Acid7E03_39580 [Acidisoma sp. 7E03]
MIPEDIGAGVEIRRRTREEKRKDDEGAKRGFTNAELKRLFDSPLFVGCYSRFYRHKSGNLVYKDSKFWIMLVALMTGGRVEELATAPSHLVNFEGVLCLDLTRATKTLNSPRLVPIQKALRRIGFVAYASSQAEKGALLFEDRQASADWSKWTNRYIDNILGNDVTVSFHSFRHTFRQSCSAAGFGDYLADKLMGHKGDKRSMGSHYGKALTPDEARLVAEKLCCPIHLDHIAI